MLQRNCSIFLLSASLAILAGCTSSQVDTVAVSPASQTVAVGQTAQFTATATTGHGNHPSSTSNVTDTVTWTSSETSVATISSGGVATAVSPGSTTITASMQGFTGLITSSATLTVTGTGTGTPSSTISSLAIIPATQSVPVPGDTVQFIAIGTTSTGATVDLSGQVAWGSSSRQIATIGASSGLATAVGQGTAAITALYTSNGITLTASATLTVVSGTTEAYTAVSITPGSESVSASGQTGQFIALATSGTTGLQVDVTNSPNITWISSVPTVASISSGKASGNGVVTGKSQGTTTITAELKNPDGSLVTNTAAVTVTLTTPAEPILSLTIIPNSISVNDFRLTGQFLAIATYSTPPYIRDVTNSPNTTWLSTEPEIFPVDTNSGGNSGASAGLVTAYGSGGAVIVAETASSDGTIQTASSTFNCPEVLPVAGSSTPGSCYPGEPPAATLLETLTVYNEGLNTTNWEITASSATGTPDVIHCGPGWTLNGGTGGSVCTATYPVGTVVTLTSPAGAGNFGGWSYNCVPTGTVTAAGPNSCKVTLSSNDTVGAIIN